MGILLRIQRTQSNSNEFHDLYKRNELLVNLVSVPKRKDRNINLHNIKLDKKEDRISEENIDLLQYEATYDIPMQDEKSMSYCFKS